MKKKLIVIVTCLVLAVAMAVSRICKIRNIRYSKE